MLQRRIPSGRAGRPTNTLVFLLAAALLSCSFPGNMTGEVGRHEKASDLQESRKTEATELIEKVAAALFTGGYRNLHGFQQGTIALAGNSPLEYAKVRGSRADGKEFSVMAVRMGTGDRTRTVVYVTPVGEEGQIYSPTICYRNTRVEGFASNCEFFTTDLNALLTTQGR